MNGLIAANIVLTGAITGLQLAIGEYPAFLMGMMTFAVCVQIVGAILIASGTKKPGAYMVGAGSLLFIPLGLVGLFGARKVLEQLNREQFEARKSEIGSA